MNKLGAVLAIAFVCSSCATLDGGREKISSLRELRLIQSDTAANLGRVVAFRGTVLTADSGAKMSALQIQVTPGYLTAADAGEVFAVAWPGMLGALGIAKRDEIPTSDVAARRGRQRLRRKHSSASRRSRRRRGKDCGRRRVTYGD